LAKNLQLQVAAGLNYLNFVQSSMKHVAEIDLVQSLISPKVPPEESFLSYCVAKTIIYVKDSQKNGTKALGTLDHRKTERNDEILRVESEKYSGSESSQINKRNLHENTGKSLSRSRESRYFMLLLFKMLIK